MSGQLSYSQEQINALKLGRNNKLYQVVLYLAPGDYHRFHSPTELSVVSKTPIGGRHMSVNEKTLARKKKVYEKNARLCLTGTWSEGFLAMVMVGALNVSKIVMSEQLRFRKGDEIGYFNLGSTIVLLFEAKNVLEWKVS